MPKATITDKNSLPEVMTVKDVIAFLGLSRPKAYELMQHPDFPVKRVGMKYLISKRALIRWLEGEDNGAI